MEFTVSLVSALVSLLCSLFAVKKFMNKSNIANKVLKVLTATTLGALLFELILYLLTTIVVIQCGGNGNVCDMAYLALLFWFPLYLIVALIVTTIWVRKKP